MNIKGLCVALLLSSSAVQAQGFKDNLRKYSNQFLGNDITVKIFGEEAPKYKLPSIPKVTGNAKSVATFDVKEENNISKQQMEEYNITYLRELYPAVRKVEINDNELIRWLNVMNQGANREGIYRAIVLDDTYRGLENFGSGIPVELIGFVNEYMGEYLNRSIPKEDLENSNFYKVKRIVVENTLEIVDVIYATNREGFFDWYAIFSSDMAKKYPNVWQNKMRKSQSATSHRNWAIKQPSQFVKSEIIIKLHILMNSNGGQ